MVIGILNVYQYPIHLYFGAHKDDCLYLPNVKLSKWPAGLTLNDKLEAEMACGTLGWRHPITRALFPSREHRRSTCCHDSLDGSHHLEDSCSGDTHTDNRC